MAYDDNYFLKLIVEISTGYFAYETYVILFMS